MNCNSHDSLSHTEHVWQNSLVLEKKENELRKWAGSLCHHYFVLNLSDILNCRRNFSLTPETFYVQPIPINRIKLSPCLVSVVCWATLAFHKNVPSPWQQEVSQWLSLDGGSLLYGQDVLTTISEDEMRHKVRIRVHFVSSLIRC